MYIVEGNEILRFEVNFLTLESIKGDSVIQTIESEFDFVQLCQSMIKPFGSQARDYLDRFIALSLRKFLCDDNSLLRKTCPEFKMPPLEGYHFECPGEKNDMRIHEIHPDIRIKPQIEWIALDRWLETKIAWIDKGIDDIPAAYDYRFFHNLEEQISNIKFTNCFIKDETEIDGRTVEIWKVKPQIEYKEIVYSILKEKGYYDLTIRRMIKFFADKQGAHLDDKKSSWFNLANSGKDWRYSAISVFATHMIYAATRQIHGLKDYLIINPQLETL